MPGDVLINNGTDQYAVVLEVRPTVCPTVLGDRLRTISVSLLYRGAILQQGLSIYAEDESWRWMKVVDCRWPGF